MLKLFKKGDFADSCGWNSFVLRLKSNFLQRIDLVGISIPCLVDNTVGAFTNYLNLLVLINLGFHYLVVVKCMGVRPLFANEIRLF